MPIIMYLPSLISQESTKYSPFEVMFGRKARLPVDINTEAVQDPEMKLRQYANKLEPDGEATACTRRKMEEQVKANIELAQNKQKKTMIRSLVPLHVLVLEVRSL